MTVVEEPVRAHDAANVFHPCKGFRAFPCQRNSTPWFDGRHRTLRGASLHTMHCVRRPGFRNFHTPEKRHVFAWLKMKKDDFHVLLRYI